MYATCNVFLQDTLVPPFLSTNFPFSFLQHVFVAPSPLLEPSLSYNTLLPSSSSSFFFYSPILLFLILYSQLRARRVDRLRACVNTHIICDRNMHFKLVFFRPEIMIGRNCDDTVSYVVGSSYLLRRRVVLGWWVKGGKTSVHLNDAAFFVAIL